MDEAEDWINDLEDKVGKNTQSNKKKKRHYKWGELKEFLKQDFFKLDNTET